jgi:hypothetical protein
MVGLGSSPEEALIASALAAMAVTLVLSGILRWRKIVSPTDFLLPVAFLGSYWLTYNKVPTFPPVGAVNKIFYLVLIGILVGTAADLLKLPRLVHMLALCQPAATALYIGAPRLSVAPWEVILAALFGVSAILLLMIDRAGSSRESSLRRGSVLAVVSLGFAPIALLGASSSTFQLCLIFAATCFGALVWHLRNPAFRFGGASFLGAAGGLIATADTVVLITRKTDLMALAILGLSLVFPPLLAPGLSKALGIARPFTHLAVYIALALLPAGAAVAVAFFNYGASFPV